MSILFILLTCIIAAMAWSLWNKGRNPLFAYTKLSDVFDMPPTVRPTWGNSEPPREVFKEQQIQQKEAIIRYGSKLGSAAANNTIRAVHFAQPPEEIKINPALVPSLKKTVDLIVGKYKLTSPELISCAKNSVKRAFRHLETRLSPDQILIQYDPDYSNELILEVCRDLFDHPSTETMTKLLIGQFIANKTPENAEIDAVYNFVSHIALDPSQPSVTRMNAADILNLTNNKRLMATAERSLNLLRSEEPARTVTPRAQETTFRRRQGQARVETVTPRYREPARMEDERNDVRIIPPMILRNDEWVVQQALWQQFEDVTQAPKPRKTIYGDNQNTHDTSINNSVLDAAKELVKNHTPATTLNFDYGQIVSLPQDQKTKIESSLHRILTDPTTFKHGTSLFSIFQALLNFIRQHPSQQDLNQRLIQELIEMSSLCATGHLSRLINVVQGFDVNPAMKIKVSIKEEVYATVKHSIETRIQTAENSDDLMDSMIGEDRTLFLEFCKETARDIFPQLVKEYTGIADEASVKKEIENALRSFTRQETITI